MARILIVDDQAPLRDSLSYALTKEGHGVVTAEDGATGLAIAMSERLDAVVLDLMLPVMDGMRVCREIRKSSDVPIIILTAKDTPTDTIDGLDAGADDYVSKPFNTRELVARIGAVLRRREPVERLLVEDRDLVMRMDEIIGRSKTTEEAIRSATASSDVLRQGPVAIDLAGKRAFVLGSPLELLPEEYSLLSILVINANRVVTRTELIGRLWGPVTPERLDMLDAYVRRLRQKIEQDPSSPKYLRTLPGIGFEFADR